MGYDDMGYDDMGYDDMGYDGVGWQQQHKVPGPSLGLFQTHFSSELRLVLANRAEARRRATEGI
jgi:hypothetical protein